ncbi:MAG: type II toxin-antitoxin system VapC family toxin [Rhizobiaceae bacterium]
MLAVDTNIIIRLLANDEPRQAEIARNFVEANRTFVPKTVLLECEWVLRGTYQLQRAEIFDRLRAFAGLETVEIEDSYAVEEALDLYSAGLDFADALHLQSSVDCEAMVTFDRDFVKRAKRAGLSNVRQL